MNTDQKDILAAEYVLGTLDENSRVSVRKALSSDPALAQAVQVWEGRLTSLEQQSAAMAPPAELWARIQAALDDEQQREPGAVSADTFSASVRAGEGNWKLIYPGVEKKTLFTDGVAGYESALFRLAPGGRIPPHTHSKCEECLMLEGELDIDDQRYVAGDYFVMSAGTAHPEIVSLTGSLLFVRGELRDSA